MPDCVRVRVCASKSEFESECVQSVSGFDFVHVYVQTSICVRKHTL